jgi:hypothetical protein
MNTVLTSIDPCELLKEHGHRSNYDSLEHSSCTEQGPNSDKLQFQCIPCGWRLQIRLLLCNTSFIEQRLRLNLQELDF